MDKNRQKTTVNKIWLPPSFISKKASVASAPKKSIKWGFANRTGFDWLNLIGVLAVPFVVTMLGLYATQQITFQQAQLSEQQHQTDLQIATDQQRENILLNYEHDISDLIFAHGLLTSKEKDEVRIIARATTLSAFQRLDPARKGVIVRFLYESQLIITNKPIISLNGANLSGVKLVIHEVPVFLSSISLCSISSPNFPNIFNFNNINFSGADLASANFDGVDMSGANLSGANLSNITFGLVNLTKANLENVLLVASHFERTILSGANLSNSVLKQVDLGSGNCLEGANLSGIEISNTNMSRVDLSHDEISNATFADGTTLEGANLSFANLSHTWFWVKPENYTLTSDLSNTDLSYANLTGAEILPDQLNKVKSLHGATMPDGSIHP